jgi:hypothetical protein
VATSDQADFFGPTVDGGPSDVNHDDARALIDQLIADTNLYITQAAQRELFDFIARFKTYAPFNAMLLHVLKPGLTYVANVRDWAKRFQRYPKPDVWPLLILQPFGPVNFVYDIQDREGREMPEGVLKFEASGELPHWWISHVSSELDRQDITLDEIDVGDGSAGNIQLTKSRLASKDRNLYRIAVNRNHAAPSQFTTIAHELAHLFLCHLGADPKRHVKDRQDCSHSQQEVEAESAAYLVAHRAWIEPRSQTYLKKYKDSFPDLDLHTIMRTAGKIARSMKMPFYETLYPTYS